MTYQMTPARRAALRKAQLISARKRRKTGIARVIAHDTRQRVALAYREGQLKHYRSAPQREIAGEKVKRLPGKAARKGAKYAAKRAAISTAKAGITIGAATAIGYTARGMVVHSKSQKQFGTTKASRVRNKAAYRHLNNMGYDYYGSGGARRVKSTRVHPVFGAPVKALPMGPKGRATVKRRATMAKKRSR